MLKFRQIINLLIPMLHNSQGGGGSSDAVVNSWLLDEDTDATPTPDLDPFEKEDEDDHEPILHASLRDALNAADLPPDPVDDKSKEEAGKKSADPEKQETPPVKTGTADAPPATPMVRHRQKAAEPKAEDKPAAKAEVKPSPDDETKALMETLSPREKHMVEFWQFAESYKPDAYKGRFNESMEFVKKMRDKRAELEAEDPDIPVDNNPDFQDWVRQNRPKIDPDEAQMVRDEWATTRAEERATQRVSKDLNEIRRKQLEQELAPTIKSEVKTFSDRVFHATKVLSTTKEGEESSPLKEIVDTFASVGEGEDGFAKIREEFPEDAERIELINTEALRVAEEYVRMSKGVKEFNPQDQYHSFIASKLHEYESDMKTNPANRAHLVREGRKFTTRSEWNAMPDGERQKHWFIDDRMFLDIVATDYATVLKQDIETRHKKFKEIYGMSPIELRRQKRKGASASTRSEGYSLDDDSPRASASRSMGSGATDSPSSTPHILDL